MVAAMPTVTYLPSGRTVEVESDQDLLTAALDADIAIATVCGGVASCTECKVKVVEGQDSLSTMEHAEEAQLGNVFFITKERLACQTRPCGPLVVEVLKEETADKRGKARERALRRSKENLARKAARQQQATDRGGDRPPAGRGEAPADAGAEADPSRRRGQGRRGHGAAQGAAQGAAEGGTPRRKRSRRRRGRRRGGRGGSGGGGDGGAGGGGQG